MDVREKLMELIKEGIRKGLRARGDDRLDYSFEDVADYLIANGVTVQEWDVATNTAQTAARRWIWRTNDEPKGRTHEKI